MKYHIIDLFADEYYLNISYEEFLNKFLPVKINKFMLYHTYVEPLLRINRIPGSYIKEIEQYVDDHNLPDWVTNWITKEYIVEDCIKNDYKMFVSDGEILKKYELTDVDLSRIADNIIAVLREVFEF